MRSRRRIHPGLRGRARELRRGQTPAEATLWRALRNRNVEYKFLRQFPLETFILDFYCPQAKLCVEVDGATHIEPEELEYDAYRTKILEALGCKVIRFTNEDVRYRLNAVVQVILEAVEARLKA